MLVLTGDPAARDEAASPLIAICTQRLSYMRWRFSAATISDSIEDAVLDYLTQPGRYQPTKLSLSSYVEHAARRNLIDWSRAESARHLRESAWATEFWRLQPAPGETGPARDPHDVWPVLLASDGALTDELWILVEALFTAHASTGARRRRSPREILDGIVAMLRHGGSWSELSPEFPPYSTCYRYFRRWAASGLLKVALDRLETALQRRRPRSAGETGVASSPNDHRVFEVSVITARRKN